MRTYRVVNLAPVLRSPRMGQVREFEVLSDIVLARICMAVDAYNDADTSWSSPDAAAGERTQRDSTATIQSVLDGVPAGLKNAALWEIRKYCDNSEAVLDTVRKPGPGTTPVEPPSDTMVPSVDRFIPPDAPIPPPTNPPVISEDRYHRWPKPTPPPPPPTYAPVASQDRYIPPDVPDESGPISFPPPVATGSESPQPEPPPPPPSPPPYRPPPSVATPSVGCWYVMGKGYMWGERPSGGESTGLNQKDCEAIMARDLDVRSGVTQPSQSQDMTQNPYSWNDAAGLPTGIAPGACDTSRGEFPDGRGGCRRSVSTMPGLPGGFGDSGTTAASSFSDFSSGAAPSASFMGSRRVALRGVHGNGNLEWWSYQQAFLPPLFFAKRRTRYATLGVGKPMEPGLCCQATDDGGAICSDGHGFPPTCPNKPEPNVPGVAARINQEGYLVPKPPPAPVNGVCAAPGAPAKKADEGAGFSPLLGIAAVGALVFALVESL